MRLVRTLNFDKIELAVSVTDIHRKILAIQSRKENPKTSEKSYDMLKCLKDYRGSHRRCSVRKGVL